MLEVKELCGQICLGKQGENLARMVCFNEPEQWKTTFGEGKCELLHQRSEDSAPYPVILDIENDKICWKITNADTAMIGEGKCELHYVVDNVVVKSKIWTTTVLPSLGEVSEEPPEPQKAWVDQVLNAAQMVESATTHQPTIGENKNWFIWDSETQGYVDSGVLAEGKKGSINSGRQPLDLSEYSARTKPLNPDDIEVGAYDIVGQGYVGYDPRQQTVFITEGSILIKSEYALILVTEGSQYFIDLTLEDKWSLMYLPTYIDVLSMIDEAVLNHDTEVQEMISASESEVKAYADELFSSIVNGNEVAY